MKITIEEKVLLIVSLEEKLEKLKTMKGSNQSENIKGTEKLLEELKKYEGTFEW